MKCKYEEKRILFLIGSMRRGGAERVISILANNYVQQGWSVDIMTLLDQSIDYELNEKINVIDISSDYHSRLRQLPSWIKNIRSYVKRNNPDRIVSFIARINIITILSCLGLNQKIIISERNDPKSDGRNVFVKLATNLLYPLTKKIVFQTKWAQSCFPKKVQRKSVIIPNPINVTTSASIHKNKKIVAVGRLEKQKNHELLIRAFSRIRDEYPQYSLYIFGEGSLRNYLTELVDDLELNKNVFLPGNVSNIHEIISDAEIFVLSSNYEGLSNALLEAMMMGIPCISTNCAGSNEIINNEENGIIVPIGDEYNLYLAILRLLKSPDLRNKISQLSKQSSRQFELNSVLKNWEEVIE